MSPLGPKSLNLKARARKFNISPSPNIWQTSKPEPEDFRARPNTNFQVRLSFFKILILQSMFKIWIKLMSYSKIHHLRSANTKFRVKLEQNLQTSKKKLWLNWYWVYFINFFNKKLKSSLRFDINEEAKSIEKKFFDVQNNFFSL